MEGKARQVAETKDFSPEELRDSIRTELLAFPGVTVSMLAARLNVKRGPSWRTELDNCLSEGFVTEEGDEMNGRRIYRLYWTDSQNQDTSETPNPEPLTSAPDQVDVTTPNA